MVEKEKTVAPPYVPFRSLTNFIEKTQPGSLPPKVDRDYFNSMAGGQRWPFMSALRWLSLITDDGVVQPSLVDLVDHTATRKEHLSEIIRTHYKWLDPLNAQKATMGTLRQSFEQYAKGSTQKKAIRFYLQAAQYAGITLSPNFNIKGLGEGATSAPRARTRRLTKQRDPAPPPPPRREDETPPIYKVTIIDHMPREVQGALAQLPDGGTPLTVEEIEDLVTVFRVALKRAYGRKETPNDGRKERRPG